MLDAKLLRSDIDTVAQQLAKRGFSLDTELFQQLDARRREADIQSQNLQAERKKASGQIGALVKSGKSVDEAKQAVAEVLNKIDEQLQDAVKQSREANDALQKFLLDIPNVPHAEVPAGKDENDNIEISRWGEPKQWDFQVRDHVDLGELVKGLDSDLGAKITGTRFTVMRGGIAKMHRALI